MVELRMSYSNLVGNVKDDVLSDPRTSAAALLDKMSDTYLVNKGIPQKIASGIEWLESQLDSSITSHVAEQSLHRELDAHLAIKEVLQERSPEIQQALSAPNEVTSNKAPQDEAAFEQLVQNPV